MIRLRRATFAATPAEDAKRPDAATQWPNLVLAGDWTQTGLPATIEGAISGRRGHDRCFRAACVLVQKFGLSFEQAWPLLKEWSEACCEPPWSDRELEHKLRDALKQRR